MGLTYDQQEPIWDARPGIVHLSDTTFHECVRRLHRALPTADHAERLVDGVLEALGDRGRLDPCAGPQQKIVRRAEPDGWWLRRSPVAFHGGQDWHETDVLSEVPMSARPADPPPEVERTPDIAPRGLGKAALTFCHGAAALEVKYDDRGLARPDRLLTRFGDRWGERRFAGRWPPSVDPTARPPQAPPPPWFVDLPEHVSVHQLVERIVTTDPTIDPVRVRMNVDAPGGIEGRWWQAMMTLRKLAFLDRIPHEGGVIVVDAYEHDPELACVAVGRTLEEAEAAWLKEERRVRPRPVLRRDEPVDDDEPPPDPPEPTETEAVDADGKRTVVLSTGTIRLVARPVTEIPWPIPGPLTTPAVAVRYPPLPKEIPPAWRAEGFSRWRYLVGESTGRVGCALLRDEADGFTQVGEGMLDIVDPRGVERAMAAATEAEERFPWPEDPWLEYPFEHRHYSAWSNLRQAPTPLTAAGASWNLEWNWADADGDLYRWRVTRMRDRS
jgi:hypothetical protein